MTFDQHRLPVQQHVIYMNEAPTWVYVHIGAEPGEALYVGMTKDPKARMRSHERTASWWPQVVDVACIGPFDRGTATAIEAEFLDALQPVNNVFGTSRDPRTAANRRRPA